MTENNTIDLLKSKVSNVKTDVSMAEYTTFRCGGNAKALVTAETAEELKTCLSLLKGKSDYIFIGNGSNILFASDYDGVVIKLGKEFSEITITEEEDGAILEAGAAVLLGKISKAAANSGLSGIECACGIPGSLGGACVMNAGAYGFEMKQVLCSVRVLTSEGNITERNVSELNLGYRHSIFMENGDIVLSAKMHLKKGSKDAIEALMADCMQKRNAKQPVNLPSAGSFFKRPEGYFAGKLVEDCGLKGCKIGGAQVSPLHAGFIVNAGNATAKDVVSLMHVVQETVLDKFGVSLEPEVRIIG